MTKPFLPRNLAQLLLFLLDGLGIFICFNVAHFIRAEELYGLSPIYLTGIILVTSLIFYFTEAYTDDELFLDLDLYTRTSLGVFLSGMVISALVYMGALWGTDPILSRFVFPFAMILFMFWANGWRRYVFRWVVANEEKRRWLICGEKDLVNQFRADFIASREYGELVCLIFDSEEGGDSQPNSSNNLEKLKEWLDKGIAGVITGFEASSSMELNLLLVNARMKGVRIFNLADFYEIFWSKVPVMDLEDRWFIFSSGFDLIHNQHWLKIKRYMDIIFSIILTILMFPVMLLTALIIKIKDGGPVFYSQRRTGKNGKEFTLYKFRTMVVDAEVDGAQWTSKDDARVTSLGWFLRLTHIDELPQVLNILKGEMSFIGPRPERPEFIGQFVEKIPYYDFRHLVKPGITGWGQVMGHHYGSSVEDVVQKLQYDLYYLKNYSLLLDISIIFKTARLVLFAKGR
jgi:exopolysaccharide biosynthesis polyprenyl glycosylphosphotransferase